MRKPYLPLRPNKSELIQKLKQLESISQEERSYLIKLINTRYGLIWEEKPEEAEDLLKSKLPVLKEVIERRILVDFGLTELKANQVSRIETKVTSLFPELENIENRGDSTNPVNHRSETVAPNHILIEGDNLHALTALSFTHDGKVDVIYIDPPYNTGNKDFKYNDIYVDKEDSYRHSKWLSFMEKRLKTSKKLLSRNGVILISIDENEIAELKLLCNEIFGSDKFIAQITLLCNPKGRSQDKYFNTSHEYCLIYSKNNIEAGHFSVFKNDDEIASNYKLKDQTGRYRLMELRNTHREFNKENRPNLFYPIYVDAKTKQTSLKKDNIYSEMVEPIWSDGFQGCWTWGKELFLKDNHLLLGVQKEGEWKIYRKSYSHTNEGEVVKKKLFTIWNDSSFFTERGQVTFGDIFPGFNKNDFPQPKSIDYIKQLLASSSKANSKILDFFAGSGTTLHATMQLNAEDGGNRQCILVTNNENKICEEVTYERNRRVIQGYTNSKGEWVKGLTNNNLRYYKTEFVPSLKDEQNKRLLTQSCTDLLCIKEDCYSELTESEGFNSVRCRIFTNDRGKYLMVVFHSRRQTEVYEQLIDYIKSLGNLKEPIKLYAFSPEKETLMEDFLAVADKIEAVPLPEAIYNAYRATFKTLKLDRSSEYLNETSENSSTQNTLSDENELSDPNQDPE